MDVSRYDGLLIGVVFQNAEQYLSFYYRTTIIRKTGSAGTKGSTQRWSASTAPEKSSYFSYFLIFGHTVGTLYPSDCRSESCLVFNGF